MISVFWQLFPVFQLTSNRAPPPKRRKGHRLERRAQSENIDDLLRQKSNEQMINDINRQRTTVKAENPLLVRVRNEKVAKSLDILDSDTVHDSNLIGSPQTSPRLSSLPSKANGGTQEVEVNGLLCLLVFETAAFLSN